MASKNQLLGHGDAGEEVKAEESDESLVLYRKDFTEGREFPADMVKMMKYKGWREQPFEEPVKEEPAEDKSTQAKGSFFDLSGKKD